MQRASRILNPGVRAREMWAWAMLDFANSGYTTVVLTAVYSAYFVGVVSGSTPWATFAWTATLSVSYLLVMCSLPLLTAYADAHAGRRRLLFTSVAACVMFTGLLALTGPGDIWLAVLAVVCSNYSFSLTESAIASFLPSIARQDSLGRVSGIGWGVGYVGGLFSLAVALWIVTQGQSQGLEAQVTVPQVMLWTATIFALAALPAWFLLREREPERVARPKVDSSIRAAVDVATNAWTDHLVGFVHLLAQIFTELDLHFSEFRRLLLCIVCYQAGISIVITLAAVYAEQVMGFGMTQTIILIVAVNITAAIGALSFGYVQDRLGHRRALGCALVGWLITSVTAYAAVDAVVFWFAACLAGLCMGTTQSAGRAMVGAFAPVDRLSRFFGLWSFSTQLAAAIGPLSYGVVTWVTGGDQRLAMLCTSLFFITALIMLKKISWEHGQKQKVASYALFSVCKQEVRAPD